MADNSNTKVYSNRDRKTILDKLSKLSETEHDEVFKIIRQNDIPFTQNKNGLFINLSLVDDEVVQIIEKFVDFCIRNNHELDEYDKRITECKINNNYDKIMQKPGESLKPGETEVPMPTLKDVIAKENKRIEDWQKALKDERVNEKVASLAKMLEDNIDKQTKKKTSMKYVNAKKKYSRRFAAEKKDLDLSSNLSVIPFICS